MNENPANWLRAYYSLDGGETWHLAELVDVASGTVRCELDDSSPQDVMLAIWKGLPRSGFWPGLDASATREEMYAMGEPMEEWVEPR